MDHQKRMRAALANEYLSNISKYCGSIVELWVRVTYQTHRLVSLFCWITRLFMTHLTRKGGKYASIY